MADINLLPTDPEVEMLRRAKDSGYNYRERRQEDWRENYTLYRDRVTTNRLTQRQSVNLPLMKQSIRTLLKDVDDMPIVQFESLDNDKQSEVFQNEYWKWTLENNKAEVKDIVDKRQVFLYGRSFDQWQIVDGKIIWTIQDPEDMLVDRYCDPADLDSARYLIHTHIFQPLSTLENNPTYDKKALAELKNWYATDEGLIKSSDTQKMLIEKNKKMADMGLDDVDSPVLSETYVELTMYFMKKDEGQGEQIYLYVVADDMKILSKKPLDEVIGKTKNDFWKTHFPYTSWADDVDRQDFWSDGVADIIRTPNKVLNAWFSQLVENRTLRNFGMHYYDSSIEGFQPQTFNPVPWGWYGVPGKPQDVLQKVDIPDLSESLDEMQFVIGMTEKATGATATQQGVQTEKKITLGEVQLALGEAKERVKGMSKFYTPAWKDRALKFLMLIEAASDKIDAVKISKKGRNTNDLFTREIEPKDWMTKQGYTTRIWSQDDKNTQDSQMLEKMGAVKANMPDNPKVNEVYQRKLLEFAGMTPEEINDAMEFEKQKMQSIMQGVMGQGMGQSQPQGIMGTEQVPQIIPPVIQPTPAKKKPTKKPDTINKLKSLKSKI